MDRGNDELKVMVVPLKKRKVVIGKSPDNLRPDIHHEEDGEPVEKARGGTILRGRALE